MAAEQKIINGRLYEQRKVYRNVSFTDADGKTIEKKIEGFVAVPVVPAVFADRDDDGKVIDGKVHPATDDDKADWLADAIANRVMPSWSVCLDLLLAQLPISGSKLAFPAPAKKDADKFTTEQMIEIFTIHRPKAIAALGPNPDATSEAATKIYEASVYAESVRLFHQAHAEHIDYTNWNANDHVVMPSDIK